MLALLARAKSLDGDAEGAAEVAKKAYRLATLAQSEGWAGGQIDYAMACVAAATGSSAQALDHLRDAIGAGWDDFVFANHDPALADIVQLPEYRALSR
jgi:hypothetical protein